MTAPSFTYSGNIYTAAAAGATDFALTSSLGNAIAYLQPAHIHVYKSTDSGSTWTELTRPSQWDFVSGGTVARLGTGIASGDWIKVQRITPSSSAYVTFQSSSLLTADQLNDDTLFNTYLNQERYDQGDQSSAVAAAASAAATTATAAATAATATANSASAAAAAATTTANAASASAATALSQSGTALTDSAAALAASAAAVTTANTAATNAASAVATAGTANTNATAAVNTANSAAADTATALTQSNTAIADSATALSTATAAAADAATALSQSNTAITDSATALSTANTAATDSASAVTTANAADAKADSAIAAISSSAVFTPVANVAAIPASPTNGESVQVTDSTGIESFTPLAGVPVGFVGDSGIAARIQYSGATWNWFGYFATNSDARYLKTSGGTLTGQLKADDSTSTTAPVYSFDGDTNTGLARTGADELALVTGGAARLTADGAGNVNVPGSVSTPAVSSGLVGVTTSVSFIDQTNSTYAVSITPSSGATANSTYTLPSSTGSNGQLLSTNGSGGLSWTNPVDISGKLDTSAIGTTVQAYDAQLADIAGLTPADGAFIVGNGTNFVAESGSTALTSIGAASSSTSVSAGTGLTGGGDLSANRTLSADIASQAEAEAGTNSSKLMTPERTKQAITALSTAANFQEFTSSGTWTKPASCNFVLVEVWGGGGGGGSGGRNGSGANGGTGGGGGGGGAYNQRLFKAADVSSSVTVTIGSGGTGGASPGAGTNNAGGNQGNSGGNTTFGSLLTGYGGGGGMAGTGSGNNNASLGGAGGGTLSEAQGQYTAGDPVIAATQGGAFGGTRCDTVAPYQNTPSGWGGAAGGTGRADATNYVLTPLAGACSSHGGAGGGAGGGWNGSQAGARGGSAVGSTGGGGTTGTSGGGAGGAGSARQGGGGGGSAAGGTNGGAGGAGGQPGGGGGGGGQAFQPGAPGAGGAGGAGLCRVYTW